MRSSPGHDRKLLVRTGVMRRALAVACLSSVVSCNHADVAVSPPTAAAAPPFAGVPDTHHIAPLTSLFGNISGAAGGYGGLIGTPAALYGATPSGGYEKCTWEHGSGCGVIYKLTPEPGTSMYDERKLHVFKGGDGKAPIGTFLMSKNGEIYGTTYAGGTNDAGVIFKMSASGSGYSVIHNFGGARDGAYPAAGVIEVNGILYGTTVGGGKYHSDYCYNTGGAPDGSCGTLYSFDETSGTEKVLHSFGHGDDGLTPYAAPIYVNGTLYGTTPYGGDGVGIVFAFLLASGTEQILSSSPGGAYPFGGLLAIDSSLYGTTDFGGKYNGGTVFKLEISSRHVRVLHNFPRTGLGGSASQGAEPLAALIYRSGRLLWHDLARRRFREL